MSQSYSKRFGALVLMAALSGVAQAATPQDDAAKRSTAEPALMKTAMSTSGQGASDFIAALKAKLESRNATTSSQQVNGADQGKLNETAQIEQR